MLSTKITEWGQQAWITQVQQSIQNSLKINTLTYTYKHKYKITRCQNPWTKIPRKLCVLNLGHELGHFTIWKATSECLATKQKLHYFNKKFVKGNDDYKNWNKEKLCFTVSRRLNPQLNQLKISIRIGKWYQVCHMVPRKPNYYDESPKRCWSSWRGRVR